MSDPTGLDERLRAALGGAHHLETGGARPGARLDAARSQVLAGIRRRRARRLQVMGAAAVVVLGLAVGLPQVLRGATPTTQAAGSHAASAPEAFTPSMHENPGPAVHPAAVATASCLVQGRTVSDCGALATDSAAGALRATAASSGRAPAYGSMHSTNGLGPPLVVGRGTTFVVELPAVEDHWRWDTPSIAGAPRPHGSPPPVTVRATRSSGTVQEFLVTTKAPATVVLEAQDDVFTGPGAAPSSVAGSAPAWALELHVEGT